MNMGPTVRHSRPHMCSNILFFFTFSLHHTDISSLPLLFCLFFLSFLLKLGFFSCFSFSYLFFFFFWFFFMVGFFHLLLFFLFSFFFFFFFTMVSFLSYLLFFFILSFSSRDDGKGLQFQWVKVCFLGLELWILWGNFFGISFCFYFHYIYAKEFAMMLKVLVDGFDFW